jgi:uncharacterized membrane protein
MPKSTGRKKKQREAERREHARNACQKTHKGQNIGDLERVVSTILGGTLLVRGLARRSIPGLAIAATGAAFLFPGGTGHCIIYESLGLSTYRNSLNHNRFIDLPPETARSENSIEKNTPFLETGTQSHSKEDDQ